MEQRQSIGKFGRHRSMIDILRVLRYSNFAHRSIIDTESWVGDYDMPI